MKNLKYAFSRLSRPKKVVLTTSLLASISCVMPWYNDLSVYGVSDTFLGITGPLFLAGFFVLAMSVFVTLMIGMPMMGKRFIKLPVKPSIIAMASGIQSLFLLLIVNSVFYHSKFGVSISQKGPGFGMTIAMVAVIGLIVGSYFWYKEEFAYKGFDEQVGRKEPLIKMHEQDSKHQTVNSREQRPIATTEKAEVAYSGKTPRRGFGFKESSPGENVENLVKASPSPRGETVKKAEEASYANDHGGKEKNMKIRMDL